MTGGMGCVDSRVAWRGLGVNERAAGRMGGVELGE